MRRRSILITAGILVLLLLLIYLESGPVRDTGRDVGRAGGGTLLPALGPGEISGFRWVSAVGAVTLTRSESSRWRVRIAGRDVPCDPLQVEELLTVARRCRVVRVMPGDEIDAGRLDEFRLEPPTTTVAVTVGDVTHLIGLGAMSVARDVAYARRQGETDVLLVDSSLTETLASTTAADLRQRRVVDWGVSELRGVEVRDGERVTFRASREAVQHEWVASVPFEDFVDPLAIDSRLLPRIVSLSVDSFVKDGVTNVELEQFGLADPRYVLVVSRGPADVRTILVGKDVAGAAGRAYVMEKGLPFVLSCRVDRLVEVLLEVPGKLRDKNITRLGETPLVRVAVRCPPAEDFEFLFEHGDWRLEKPERQPLETSALKTWLDLMRDLSALEFLDGADPVALGLADPAGEVSFWAPGEAGEVEVVRLLIGKMAPDDRGVYVQRKGAASAVLAHPGLLRLLKAGHFAVKRLGVLPVDWQKLDPKAISQRVGALVRTRAFDGERWDANADEEAVEAIFLCLKRLAAVRWLGRAEGREEEFGFLPAPAVEVRMTFSDVTALGGGQRVYGISIGGETVGGRFARAILEGRPGADVFLLSAADYRILSRSIK